MHSAVHAHLQPWSLPITLALAGIAVVYLCVWRRVPSFRAAAFLGGLFVGWLAIASPLVALDHELLTFHMIKHLLLMTVAAPLILWGSPACGALLGSGRTLILCWLAGAAAVIGWHVPAAFQLALGSHWWHAVENASFLLAGLVFWWPVMQSRPRGEHQWSVPLYLFLATLPCDILSAFLVFCGRVVYPSYLAAPRLFDLSPLQDQEFAGALMWVSATFIYLIPAVIITMQILSPTVEAEAAGMPT
jgi:putative membrane protein